MIKILEVVKSSGRSKDHRPFCSISEKGIIDFGQSAIDLLGFKEGDSVNFAYDDSVN